MRTAAWAGVLVLVAALARAEGVGPQKTGGEDRLYGATTVVPYSGGLLSTGGASLRRLAPGSRRWETLHTRKGDNLYRVAADDSGRVLASWEEDRFFHLFNPARREHVSIPLSASFPVSVSRLSLEHLALLRNGRDALVILSGVRSGMNCSPIAHAAYRVALDGKSEPELLFQVGHGDLLRITPHGALYAERKMDLRSCTRTIDAIVSFEVSDAGVARTVLMDTGHLPFSVERAGVIRGSDHERVALMLVRNASRDRAVARWRRGDPKPEMLVPPAEPYTRNGKSAWVMTPSGEILEAVSKEEEEVLELRRHSPGGIEPLLELPALQDIDDGVYGMGMRPNGELWVHWGDHLALLAPDRPPRGYSIEKLLERRAEWAGADIYVQAPQEGVWVGIDKGRGRHFVRLGFDEIDKHAKPWRQE